MKRDEIADHIATLKGNWPNHDYARQLSEAALLALADDAPPDQVEVVAQAIWETNREHKTYGDLMHGWHGLADEIVKEKFRRHARAAIDAYEGVREGTA